MAFGNPMAGNPYGNRYGNRPGGMGLLGQLGAGGQTPGVGGYGQQLGMGYGQGMSPGNYGIPGYGRPVPQYGQGPGPGQQMPGGMPGGMGMGYGQGARPGGPAVSPGIMAALVGAANRPSPSMNTTGTFANPATIGVAPGTQSADWTPTPGGGWVNQTTGGYYGPQGMNPNLTAAAAAPAEPAAPAAPAATAADIPPRLGFSQGATIVPAGTPGATQIMWGGRWVWVVPFQG